MVKSIRNKIRYRKTKSKSKKYQTDVPDFTDVEFRKYMFKKKFESRYNELNATQNSTIDFIKNVVGDTFGTRGDLIKLGIASSMFGINRYLGKDDNIMYKLLRDGLIGLSAVKSMSIPSMITSAISIGCSLKGY